MAGIWGLDSRVPNGSCRHVLPTSPNNNTNTVEGGDSQEFVPLAAVGYTCCTLMVFKNI